MSTFPAILLNPQGPVYFPIPSIPFNVGKPVSVAAWRRALRDGSELVLIEESVDTGLVARILQSAPVGEAFRGLLFIDRKVTIEGVETDGEGVPLATVSEVDRGSEGPATALLRSMVVQALETDRSVPAHYVETLRELPPEMLVDTACMNCQVDRPERLAMLASRTLEDTATLALPFWSRRAGMPMPGDAYPPRPPSPAPQDDLGEWPDAEEEQVRYLLRSMARSGEIAEEDLVDQAWSNLDEWFAEDLDARKAWAWEQARPIIAAQRAREAAWPEKTDAEKLDDALSGLSDLGITASLGEEVYSQDILDAFEDRIAADPSILGCVWYTTQDIEDAVNGDGIQIGFLATKDEDAPAIGRAAVQALERAGLPVWWPEDVRVRLYVPIRWQRRMP